ncbi:dipeptide ABC transporter ATP-binding protein [Arthrobacter sp. MMS24-S77]
MSTVLSEKAETFTEETEALLRVRNLRVSFPSSDGEIQAVRGVSFDVRPGQILAVVGESGSGKSVTARSLVGLAGGKARVEADELRVAGRDGHLIDARPLSQHQWRSLRGRTVGFVLQDALVSLDPLRTVGREVAEPILAHGLLPKAQIPPRVRELLASVGIPDPEIRAAQYPHELSGGLRQRALIASALAAEPRLLIADEPTTALDVTVQKQVLGLLTQIADEGHGVLLITHDLAVVAEVAHHIVVMKDGEVVESGPTRQLLSAPGHPYTRRLLAAVPSAATRGSRLSVPEDGEDARSTGPVHSARSGEVSEKPHDAAERGGSRNPDGGPVLDVRSVSVSFPRPGGGRHQAVDGVSLSLAAGETLGIVGESGSGKSTLGRVILALQRPEKGDVLLHGETWSAGGERARRARRARIQTITQDPLSSFDPQFAVERILAQPLRLHTGLDPAGRRAESVRLLELVGLGAEHLSRRPSALSGGQRQRVSIAQALASRPQVLVCDEPVSALDVTTQAQVLDLLSELQERLRLAMLFISHDLGVVQHLSHRIAVLKDGRIVETGPAEQVFAAPEHPYTRKLLAAVPALPATPGLAYAERISEP